MANSANTAKPTTAPISSKIAAKMKSECARGMYSGRSQSPTGAAEAAGNDGV
jgi:hypothetical protein